MIDAPHFGGRTRGKESAKEAGFGLDQLETAGLAGCPPIEKL
jgi:hypothetical protein